jgi:hypothetical protein
MTNDLLIYGENICAFSYVVGSPSSNMTLHPIPSKFPYTVYEENFLSFFISEECLILFGGLRVMKLLSSFSGDKLLMFT